MMGCAPKVKLVHFWSTWCSTCSVELEELRKFTAINSGASIEVQAIAAYDTRESVEKFLQNKEYPFSVIIDSDGALAMKYEITDLPTTIVLDENNQPLNVYDPLLHVYSSRFEGARSWASELMCRALEDAVKQ